MTIRDIDGMITNCQTSSLNFPIKTSEASGVIVDSSIVICEDGGKCFIFDEESRQWRFLIQMNTPRDNGAAVAVQDGLWITGGNVEGDTFLSSTELIFLDGKTKPGPRLPQPRSGHCLLQYNGFSFLIGRSKF